MVSKVLLQATHFYLNYLNSNIFSPMRDKHFNTDEKKQDYQPV